MQILCGLQVVFFLFNCQTPADCLQTLQDRDAVRIISVVFCHSLLLLLSKSQILFFAYLSNITQIFVFFQSYCSQPGAHVGGASCE